MSAWFSVLDSEVGGVDGIGLVNLVNRTRQTTWGVSREWNTWLEFHAGATLVASSANGDFAIKDGQVTEDIGRQVRRDAQFTLIFPPQPRRSSMPIFATVAGATAFTVGESTAGGTDLVGGQGAGLTDLPAPVSESTRPTLIPTGLGDLLDPNSLATILVYSGFKDEEVLLGTFDLVTTSVKADGQGSGPVVDIVAQSFERRLAKAGFWQMEAFANNTNSVDAAISLVKEVLPHTTFVYPATNAVIGELTWKPGDNRMDKITELMTVAGTEGGFKRNNDFVIDHAPIQGSFGAQPAQWELIDGVNARIATLNSASRKFSDEDSYNGVVVEGTSEATPGAVPITAAVWNLNPSSPLYFDPTSPSSSSMGPRAKYVKSELAHSYADALSIATIELAKVLMLVDSIEVSVPANPDLEMGQYARLVSDSLGVDAVFRIARVAHDLAGGPATLSLFRFTSV